MSERDVVYKISVNPWEEMELTIREFEVVKETSKSIICENGVRFPRDEIDKPIIEHHVRWFRGAYLVMYETTREEVEEFGVPKLKESVRKWLQENADYYLNFLTKL